MSYRRYGRALGTGPAVSTGAKQPERDTSMDPVRPGTSTPKRPGGTTLVPEGWGAGTSTPGGQMPGGQEPGGGVTAPPPEMPDPHTPLPPGQEPAPEPPPEPPPYLDDPWLPPLMPQNEEQDVDTTAPEGAKGTIEAWWQRRSGVEKGALVVGTAAAGGAILYALFGRDRPLSPNDRARDARLKS